MKNSIKKVSLFLILLISMISNGFLALAQSPEIDQKLNETKEEVQKLANMKDDTSISTDEKEKMEIDLKKKIIMDVIDVSSAQLKNLKEKIDLANVPQTDEWKAIAIENTKQIDEFLTYYKEVTTSINAEDLITLDKIKEYAKSLEAKKTKDIDPVIKKINNITITLSISEILKLTDQRLEKVGSDVSKIYDKKLTKNLTLKKLFTQASDLVSQAHQINDKSKEIIINVYNPEISTSTTLYIEDLTKKLRLEEDKIKQEKDKELSIIKTDDELINQNIESLVVTSLNNVKQAYDVFVKMSLNVKQYLK